MQNHSKNSPFRKGIEAQRRLDSSQTHHSAQNGSKPFTMDSDTSQPWMPKLTLAAMSAISGEGDVNVHQAEESSQSLTGRKSSHRGKRTSHRSSFLHRMAARISYAERFSGYAPLIASAMSGARLSYSGDGVPYEVRRMISAT